ncbi:MAG: peptidase M19, renal dipeptidase [Mesorhizobium sp.]|nr:MAG: peptidase M19, renal dipeptidase [Mesorhizobium sp.]
MSEGNDYNSAIGSDAVPPHHHAHFGSGSCAICAAEGILGPADLWTSETAEPPVALRKLYDKAIVIDALASPNTFNVNYPPAGRQYTAEQLENVRRSGITALNLTIGGAVGSTSVAEMLSWIKDVKDDIAANPDALILIERPSDINRAKEKGLLGIIFGFQGLEFMQDDLPSIDRFADESVMIMQLTYNGDSKIGSGCLVTNSDAGLKPVGNQAVSHINRRRRVVDLSHSHPQTALEAARASSAPIIVSHSACREIYNHPRNQPDEVLRAVADGGGVFGIFMMPYLGQDPVYASRGLFNRHLVHALSVCGEDHVGIGSDNSITPIQYNDGHREALEAFIAGRDDRGVSAPLDGIGPYIVPGLNTPRRLEVAAWDLSKAGYSDRVIEKVLGQNFQRVFAEIWAE